jgi:hypothetical protein|tara:strand:+ start:508 stop:921 length:414 start_codon:yes stop_codon:yes gene_type:complete
MVMIESTFKNIILLKVGLLILIIIWGGTIQLSNSESSVRNNLTDLGGILFTLYSVLYLITCYQLYKFKTLGKKLLVSLVLIFIILGFVTELMNPMQIDKDLFFLFIFYIVSPMFFVTQGLVIGMIYFSSIKEKFMDK